jgi:mediator of RNA polymerase II transcription subunit 27
MMMSNPGVMGQQGLPPNQGQPQPQTQQQTTTSQMIPGGINPAMSLQARQNQNDDILSRCLVQTQRLRESLQVLLNSTKQAAHIENDEQSPSSSSSTTTTNLSSNPVNSTIRNNIDRKLYDMSTSLDQLVSLIDQYDFKSLQNQQVLINHYNELSYEKQGTLMDEWSSNTKWGDKLIDIFPSIQPSTQLYRRSNYRNLNANIRSRIDGPSSPIIDRIINQFESTQQQQQSITKDYSISIQRLSDHLNIIEFSLFRSGLDIYLYIRHCTVEHIIIKPLNEKKQLTNNFNNKFLTNYRALDIIAGHIRAAAVYYAPFGTQVDQALGKLLVYIYKYQMLHAQKCVNCQKHLLNGLQPTWRDFKTYECYHEECLN